jgi:uncharacterized protein GlcG (DUF336 family)
MTSAALDARGCIVALKTEDGCGLLRPDIAGRQSLGALGMGFGTHNPRSMRSNEKEISHGRVSWQAH